MDKEFKLTRPFIYLLAISCGVAVASLYYIQPVESMIAASLEVSLPQVGLAATLIQIGYAFGLLFIVPLGDILERKRLIQVLLSISMIFLIAIGLTTSYSLLLVLVLCLGFASVVPQVIIPYSAQLAEPQARGQVLGTVMSGLLIGILLSRTISGIVSSYFGWRAIYFLGATLLLILLICITLLLPTNQPTATGSYGELLKSLPQLFRKQKVLRESAWNGFCMFGSFSAFWTSLIFLMESPAYNLGAKEAGLLGLVGVVGALIAPMVGKIADRKSPRLVIGIGTVLSFVAYLIFAFVGQQMLGLIMGIIVIDIGNQAAQVANQARVQSLGGESRSRNNTIYMFAYFVGGALGSFLSVSFWQMYGWLGVCAVGLGFQLLALLGHYGVYRRKE